MKFCMEIDHKYLQILRHTKHLHDNKIEDEMGGTCSAHENCNKILVDKSEQNLILGFLPTTFYA
jgi:hypothetical protein